MNKPENKQNSENRKQNGAENRKKQDIENCKRGGAENKNPTQSR